MNQPDRVHLVDEFHDEFYLIEVKSTTDWKNVVKNSAYDEYDKLKDDYDDPFGESESY